MKKMRPSILKINGLNSFSQTETIDFTRLTSRGLFGIFGPTGSGKSTILDAITLALYGEVARETKSYINSELDKAYIYFEFFSGHGNHKKKYIIERNIKRTKTGVSTPSVTLERYDSDDNLESVIENTRAVEKELRENIIKLNYDDFIKTVVLPQGKFNEFLTLTGGQRNNMLERILGLEEYGEGLKSKISNKRSITNDELNCLYGELSGHGDICEDSEKELKEKEKEILEEESKLKEDLQGLEKDYKQASLLYDLQEELKGYTEGHNKLLENQDEISKDEARLKSGKDALHISPYVSTLETSLKEQEDNDQKLEALTVELKNLTQEIEIVDKDYKKAYELKEKETPGLIENRARIASAIDLELEKTESQKLLGLDEESHETIKKQIEDLDLKVKDIKEKREKINSDIEKIENIVRRKVISSVYRSKLIEGMDIEKTYKEKNKQLKDLEENHAKTTERIKNGKIEINKLDLELKDLKEKSQTAQEEYLLLKKILFSKEESFKILKDQIEKIKQESLAKTLAKSLEKGCPCPVCGSRDHPDLIEDIADDSLDEKIKDQEKLEEEIQNLKNQVNLIESAFVSTGFDFERIENLKGREDFEADKWEDKSETLKEVLEKIRQEKIEIDKNHVKYNTHLENIEEGLEQINKDKKELENQLKDLKSSYENIKEELKVDNILVKYNEVKEIDKELDELSEKLKVHRDELKKIEDLRTRLETDFNENKLKLESLNVAIKNRRELIEKTSKEIISIVGEESPTQLKLTIEKKIENLARGEKDLKTKLETLREKDNKLKNEKSSAQTNKDRLTQALTETQEIIDKLLKEYDFTSIEEVKQSSIDKDQIKNLEDHIEVYKKQVENLSSNIKRIEKILEDRSISREELKKLKIQRTTALARQEELLEEKGRIVEQLNEMKKNIKRVKELKKNIEKLELRKDSLDEIFKITSGKKFVEFVSRNHLDYIARSATDQLNSITRGRYGLVLNDENAFEVIDNHSGGVRRDSSSLSGGETFLVSLALALALSTKIQLKGDTSMEFFFLDEGFGTLDIETLDTAMTALENLYTENLSIGIISHVEEIKNRVPIKLIVSPPVPGVSGSKVKIIKT